ncbi:hypothetical protein WR164_13930 [Philodulcilactobacillus myokoensis]|uniref:Uncharacterized protein n=1 Tax=Philodulcilactobacillus myokoensis TaxID=2929573 RepID=A0A9W6B4E8_9LACO|nr:hypothetical protein [Philodulcilactobacillus myokoensis]GLB47414.1 hypothetical protein WR164_13930 [Philodulcilactobacillus myokoensis]
MRLFRKPSWKKSFKARTTGKYKRRMKRAINPYYGRKGAGWGNNPKKALYNHIYHKSTRPIFKTRPTRRRTTYRSSINRNNNQKLLPYHRVNNKFDEFLNVIVFIINNIDLLGECVIIIMIIWILTETMFEM